MKLTCYNCKYAIISLSKPWLLKCNNKYSPSRFRLVHQYYYCAMGVIK